MTLERIVDVTITKETASVTRVGFGTPLLMVTHEVTGDRAKIYASLKEMEDDGFVSADLAHSMAARVFGQDPKVAQIVLGKRTRQPTRTVKLTPVSPALADTLYRVTIDSTVFDFTSDSTPTIAEIAAGLTAAIDQASWLPTTAYVVGDYVRNLGNVYICTTDGTSASSGGPTGTGSGIVDGTVVWAFKGVEVDVNATDNTTDMDVEAASAPGGGAQAGVPFTIAQSRALFDFEDNTADPGIADDLSDVRNSNDDWYSVTGDWWSEAQADAMAAVIETTQRLHVWGNSDTDVLDGAVTDDAASVMNGKAYSRTGMIWHTSPDSHPAAAWIGSLLPTDPGSATWKFKTLVGILFDTFTGGELTAMTTKKANHYIRVAGLNMTEEGYAHDGTFFDETRGLDFVAQRIAEDVYRLLKVSPKVPYTDLGLASVQAVVQGVLISATVDGGGSGQIFRTDPSPVTTVPLVADVNVNDKADRLLPDINWTAFLAGAVHNVQVNGKVSL